MVTIRHNRGLPIELIAHVDLTDMPDVVGINSDHDTRYYTQAQLGSIVAPSGSSLIGISDAGGYFIGTNVETVLQELMAVILPADYLRLDGTNIPTANYNWTTNLTTTGTIQAVTFTDGVATLTGGAWTGATYNGLTITTGVNTFTLTRGTTDLIVNVDCTIDQDLSSTSSPTFNALTVTTINGLSGIGCAANVISITCGTTDFTVSADCAINQNLNTGASPSFVNLSLTGTLGVGGTLANTQAFIQSTVNANVSLYIKEKAGQTANLTEWRDAAAALLASVDTGGNFYTIGSYQAGTLVLAGGSITDITGEISFDDENLTTTGNINSEGLETYLGGKKFTNVEQDFIKIASNAQIIPTRYSNDVIGATLTLRHARVFGGTGDYLDNNDISGRIRFLSWNGAAFTENAGIYARTTQNHASGDYGTELEFYTTPLNGAVDILRIKIQDDGTFNTLGNAIITGIGTFTDGTTITGIDPAGVEFHITNGIWTTTFDQSDWGDFSITTPGDLYLPEDVIINGDITGTGDTIRIGDFDYSYVSGINYYSLEYLDGKLNLRRSANSAWSANFAFYKSRGTRTNPTSIVSGDFMGAYNWFGYDNTDGFTKDALINIQSTGNFVEDSHPVKMNFALRDNADIGQTIKMTLEGEGNLWLIEDNAYFKAGVTDTDIQVGSDGTNGIIDVATSLRLGNATTNYTEINSTGDIRPIGSAGFYPRFLTQSTEPAAGTGNTQIDTSEMIIWKDSDDSNVYYLFNDGGTVKKVELV